MCDEGGDGRKDGKLSKCANSFWNAAEIAKNSAAVLEEREIVVAQRGGLDKRGDARKGKPLHNHLLREKNVLKENRDMRQERLVQIGQFCHAIRIACERPSKIKSSIGREYRMSNKALRESTERTSSCSSFFSSQLSAWVINCRFTEQSFAIFLFRTASSRWISDIYTSLE